MKEYKSPAALKSSARTHLFGNYGITVRAYIWMNAVLLLFTWVFASFNSSGAGGIISFLIFFIVRLILSGIFLSGIAYIYLHIVNGRQAYPGMIFYGFKNNTDRAVLICLAINALETVFSIPFIIFYVRLEKSADPLNITLTVVSALIMLLGAVFTKALFLPAYYMVHDFPDYSFTMIMKSCPKIMNRDNMIKAILIYLGFIPMTLLSFLSLGIAAPWVDSYVNATVCEMYMDLMKRG